jgi:exonuclease SbcC
MQPRNLKIKNIGPYRDVSIDLSSIPGTLIAVAGKNGQGKTMFLESMFAGAYREFPTRPEGLYTYCTDRNAGIEFEFEMAERIYRSILNIDSKNRKMEAVLSLDKQALNDGKTGSFDAEILKILGSMDQILASSYGAQDKKGNFIELVKGKRKDLFIQMIGLGLLQRISDAAAKHAAGFDSTKADFEGQIAILKEIAQKSLPDLESIKVNLAASIEKRISLQSRSEELAAQIASEGIQFDQLSVLEAEFTEKNGRLKIEKTALEATKLSLQSNKTLYDQLGGLRLTLQNARETLALMKENFIIKRDRCSQLPGLMQREIELLGKYKKLQQECVSLTARIQSQELLASHLSDLRQKNELLTDARIDIAEISSLHRQVNADIIRVGQENHQLDASLSLHKSKIVEAERNSSSATLLLENAKKAAKQLTEVPCGGVGEYATCPLISTAVESSAKIDELTANVDNCKIVLLGLRQEELALHKPDSSLIAKLTTQLISLTEKIRSGEANIKLLSGLVSSLPAAEAAESNRMILQESFNSKQQERDLASVDLEAIQSSIIELNQDQQFLVQLESDIPIIETNISDLERQVISAEGAGVKIEPLTTEIQRLEGTIQELFDRSLVLASQIESINIAKAGYQDKVSEFETLKSETIPNLQAEIENIQSSATRAEEEISSITLAQGRMSQVQTKLDEINYQIACYSRVSKSFGPMEIQSFEIDCAGPEVSRLSNDLLFKCFSPRFSIRFVTQELKADGKGYKDEFDIFVYDQLNQREGSISDLSGGEKTIVSEALSLGIALYNKEKNSIAWETLFRDEVSGALDDENAPRYIKMLRAAQAMGNFKKVYFICHQPELKAMADSRIVVENGALTVEA